MDTNRHNARRTVSFIACLALGTLVGTVPARAEPVQGQFFNGPGHCDTVPDTLLSHELGDQAVFPIDEQLFIDVFPTTNTVCVPDDGIANDYNIRIINVGSIAWTDLFFVVDEGINFAAGNSDGFAEDLNFPGVTPAFRIDAAGINNNLYFESGPADGILDPGEVWGFYVTNFDISIPPVFDSVGQFAASSSGPPSSASILANPVPEPGTGLLLGVGLLVGLGAASRRLQRKGQTNEQ